MDSALAERGEGRDEDRVSSLWIIAFSGCVGPINARCCSWCWVRILEIPLLLLMRGFDFMWCFGRGRKTSMTSNKL